MGGKPVADCPWFQGEVWNLDRENEAARINRHGSVGTQLL
jgi:hypothetical protein